MASKNYFEVASIKDGNKLVGFLVTELTERGHGASQIVTPQQIEGLLSRGDYQALNYYRDIGNVFKIQDKKLVVNEFQSPVSNSVFNVGNMIRPNTSLSLMEYVSYVDTQFRLQDIEKANKTGQAAGTINMIVRIPGQNYDCFPNISIYAGSKVAYQRICEQLTYVSKMSIYSQNTFHTRSNTIQITIPCIQNYDYNDILATLSERSGVQIFWNPNCTKNFWDKYKKLARYSQDAHEEAKKFSPKDRDVRYINSVINRPVQVKSNIQRGIAV